MKRKMRVVLEIDVADYSQSGRKEIARLADCKSSDLPSLKDYGSDADVRDIAEVLESAAAHDDEVCSELFAGTDIYVKFATISVQSAEWIEPLQR